MPDVHYPGGAEGFPDGSDAQRRIGREREPPCTRSSLEAGRTRYRSECSWRPLGSIIDVPKVAGVAKLLLHRGQVWAVLIGLRFVDVAEDGAHAPPRAAVGQFIQGWRRHLAIRPGEAAELDDVISLFRPQLAVAGLRAIEPLQGKSGPFSPSGGLSSKSSHGSNVSGTNAS